MNDSTIRFLQTLESIIDERRAVTSEESYTARLFADGPARIAQKVGEEAVELAIAAVEADRQRIICEAADLTYHLLVLLRYNEVTLADMVAELESRHR